ncbi:Mu transposase C-terminal domain-containing protein [Poseidonibacter ostreae]|uniref:DDE-type integrase/transposase/recombinase n=1 Tax=Poseidonibacter ostreae TaxID=2654171 RepID=A0A6L4WV99_9BACT|nr:DDE-type integrase/transposase/recombinase [Poseidonibacter ostreae]KAB7890287.1 DDE-type integrase/transposase/recombinase [Poseidonibacter ostreae]
MNKINLSIGTKISYKEQNYLILNYLDFESIIVEDINTKEKKIVKIQDLENENKKDFLYIGVITDKEWEEAKQRLKIIKPLIFIDRKKEEVIKMAEENNLHVSTLYRWIKLYEESTLLSSLVPKKTLRGGKGKTRTKEEVELIIKKTIEEQYLHKQKLTPRQVYNEIRRKCHNADITAPHENTIRNRIKQISNERKIETRESRRTADRQYRNTDGVFPEGTYPLDVIQIDHTPMDIIIVDEEYRQPIGRPYLTIAIDVYSRMIMGYYISLEAPSYFSVSQCLTNMLVPKEKYLREYKVEGNWNIWGIPREIHLDNAQEFKGYELQRVCEEIGISIQWRPVARPQFGGHIERLIGTSMKEVHTIPGTTFSNIQQRGDYNSEKESALTLYELEQWMCEFIVNVYHKRIHNTINMSPERKYELGIFGDDDNIGKGLPEKIENEDYLKISLLPSNERTIQQHGVVIEKIQYYENSLRRWIKAKDEKGNARKFLFKYDPRDISQIWFFDPDIKDFFSIPYKNLTYPAISQWELKAIKRYLDEKNIHAYDETIIFKAYNRMQQIKEDAVKKTKSIRKQTSSKKAHKRKKKLDFKDTQNTNKTNIQKETSIDDLFKNVSAFEEIDMGEINNEN